MKPERQELPKIWDTPVALRQLPKSAGVVYTTGGYWGGGVIDFIAGIYATTVFGYTPLINPPLVEYT